MVLRLLVSSILAILALGSGAAHAASVVQMVGSPIENRSGERVGKVDDLIVDVRAGRVLYVIVDSQGRFYTLPIHQWEPR